MTTRMYIFQRQRGGSTLIGLILGLCLGMLALIKWPHLEGPVRAFLVEHDISLTTKSSQKISPLESRSPKLEAIPPQKQPVSNSVIYEPPIELWVTDDNSIDRTNNRPPAGAVEAIQDELFPDEANNNSKLRLTQETREVWPPFSSESAAHAFAKAVSEALGIEVGTLRHSDHEVVPIVRCAEQVVCDDVKAKITAYLAGPTSAGILR